MVLSNASPKPLSDLDDTTADGAATPSETIAADLLDDDDPLHLGKPGSASSTPWPGSTFVIRCASSWRAVTLQDGLVVLTSASAAGGRGATHWECVESKGWLGFRSPVSGRFLGHNVKGWLCCVAERQQGWENFCVRARPDGGFVLLMTHYERLWRVGVREEQGVERLAKVGDGSADGMVWEFVKV